MNWNRYLTAVFVSWSWPVNLKIRLPNSAHSRRWLNLRASRVFCPTRTTTSTYSSSPWSLLWPCPRSFQSWKLFYSKRWLCSAGEPCFSWGEFDYSHLFFRLFSCLWTLSDCENFLHDPSSVTYQPFLTFILRSWARTRCFYSARAAYLRICPCCWGDLQIRWAERSFWSVLKPGRSKTCACRRFWGKPSDHLFEQPLQSYCSCSLPVCGLAVRYFVSWQFEGCLYVPSSSLAYPACRN